MNLPASLKSPSIYAPLKICIHNHRSELSRCFFWSGVTEDPFLAYALSGKILFFFSTNLDIDHLFSIKILTAQTMKQFFLGQITFSLKLVTHITIFTNLLCYKRTGKVSAKPSTSDHELPKTDQNFPSQSSFINSFREFIEIQGKKRNLNRILFFLNNFWSRGTNQDFTRRNSPVQREDNSVL